MWIFTTGGFVSAVRDKEGAMMVRARDEGSLLEMAFNFNSAMIRTPHADYPYRVILDPDQFVEWLLEQGNRIQYDNFKSAVAVTRGQVFANALYSVWRAMHAVEDAKARVW
jgi:hypothetical protein